ncbi:MAG: DUF167 domain-containing protein [Gammaproteobacteria bacterium]|nr:DUF167 domain-containing protein [Gammaproteobacteria bacterium]NNF61013.1 YggU family protein [Gammaproteobacteria bacterium]NNM21073.1 YggU family protein [Gammaproteobacteria bacterium]
MSWYRWDGADLILTLHVQPRARVAGIVGLHGDALKLKVTAPAEAGRANEDVVSLLAAMCAVTRAAVTIENGTAGRRKRVRIRTPAALPDGVEPRAPG